MTDFRNLYVKGPDFQLLASGELSVWSAVFLGRDNLLMYYQRAPFEDRHSILQGFLVINCNEAKKDFFNEGQKIAFLVIGYLLIFKSNQRILKQLFL